MAAVFMGQILIKYTVSWLPILTYSANFNLIGREELSEMIFLSKQLPYSAISRTYTA